jgi:ABC-type lipoprotein release transport system permease subunit
MTRMCVSNGGQKYLKKKTLNKYNGIVPVYTVEQNKNNKRKEREKINALSGFLI